MKKIFNEIIPPLSLLQAKGKSYEKMKSTLQIRLSKGSKKVQNIEMAVINHYKPIIKIEL